MAFIWIASLKKCILGTLFRKSIDITINTIWGFFKLLKQSSDTTRNALLDEKTLILVMPPGFAAQLK